MTGAAWVDIMEVVLKLRRFNVSQGSWYVAGMTCVGVAWDSSSGLPDRFLRLNRSGLIDPPPILHASMQGKARSSQ